MIENKDKSLEKYKEVRAEATHEGSVFVPITDIYEKDDAILVSCDMPGVAEDKIDIHLENSVLTISAYQDEARPKGYDLLSTEYDTGIFQRTFNVPQMIAGDEIKARLHNGVLHIELPKAEQAKPRKIEIVSGS